LGGTVAQPAISAMAIARRTGNTLVKNMCSIGYSFYKSICLARLAFLETGKLDELFDHTGCNNTLKLMICLTLNKKTVSLRGLLAHPLPLCEFFKTWGLHDGLPRRIIFKQSSIEFHSV
jgi:hypothetical protein